MAVSDNANVGMIADRLNQVHARINAACQRVGRTANDVRLVAVSKGHDSKAIRLAHHAGQREFAENYVQEFARKASEVVDLEPLRWRFIGHLQRNKIKEVAPIECAVDTVDSARLADALNKKAQEINRVLEVMIQVNVAEEDQKAGCRVNDLESLVGHIQRLDCLRLKGLMTIPPLEEDPENSRPWFNKLRLLAVRYSLSELSMGMSSDLEIAIEEGSTMVRVGTAIFGPRS
jgi:PLP dependent protein